MGEYCSRTVSQIAADASYLGQRQRWSLMTVLYLIVSGL